MASSKVSLDIVGDAAIATIDNPPVNALHPAVSDALVETLASLRCRPEIRGLIITGRGRHFVAGGDISYFQSLDPATAETYALRIQQMQAMLQAFDRPVIAAINGTALGGGCELAMACDIRIADETAVLGQPEVRLGIMPGAGGTQHLPRLIPMGQAKRMLFTGRPIGAAAALSIGLVDEVTPPGQCVEKSIELVHEIAGNSPLAVAQIKRAVNLGASMSVADGHRLEAALFGHLFRTEDAAEGVAAFLSKRAPQFRGR